LVLRPYTSARKKGAFDEEVVMTETKRMKFSALLLIGFALQFGLAAYAQDDADYGYNQQIDPLATDSGYSTNYDDPVLSSPPTPPSEYVPADVTEASE